MKNLIFFGSIVITIVVVSLLITNKSKIKTENHAKTVKSSAKSACTEVKFPAGTLNISPSENNKFFNSDFYNCPDNCEPQVDLVENGNRATLRVTSKNDQDHINYDDSTKCTWNLHFNKKVENEMTVNMVAGEGNLDLSGCNLKVFEFKMVAGEVHLNLRNTSLPYLNFKAAAGEAQIDLTGKWKNDLRANIKGGIGEITVKIPENIGTKIEISGILGDVNVPQSFTKNHKSYTNGLFGKTTETLYLDIFGGIGEVNIKTVAE
jgi:hypothetical protein